ncbi:MAG: hypothetical protein ACOZQL_27935 [Myxococcota bacterium]
MRAPPSPLTTFLLALLSTACATNPARGLTPNGIDPVIRFESGRSDATLEKHFFDPEKLETGAFRGDEKLDEQDFYAVIEDQPSLRAVSGSRGAGNVLQAFGIGLATLGYATAAAFGVDLLLSKGGLLVGEESPGLLPRFFDDGLAMYGGLLGGVVVGAVGLGLFFWGKEKTLGHPPVFKMKHAQQALETSLYGVGGLTPQSVVKLELKPTPFCATDPATVQLIARDAKGRVINLKDRGDWFAWSTTPDGLLEGEEVDTRLVLNPVAASLAAFGREVSLGVEVKGTATSARTALGTDFDCAPSVSVSGRRGAQGQGGKTGAKDAGSGGDGQVGGDGEAGATFVVEAANVIGPQQQRLVLVAVQREGQRATQLALVRAGTRVQIEATGGQGGRGGEGGHGGTGTSMLGKCADGRDGGAGGTGGPGGRGGDGGRVSLRVASASLTSVVEAQVSGGDGGEGGPGGRGGSGSAGGGYMCPKGVHTRSGKSGPDGRAGQRGQPGRTGRVESSVVPARSLPLISAALAANPAFQLDGDAPRR